MLPRYTGACLKGLDNALNFAHDRGVDRPASRKGETRITLPRSLQSVTPSVGCDMTARIPQSVREEQLNALPNMRFVRWLDGYRNNLSKAVMRCDHGHEWASRVDNLISGNRCPRCSGRHVHGQLERERQLNRLSGKSFVRWDTTYEGSRSYAVMRCDALGHEWSACIGALVSNKTGCPKCARQYRYSEHEREEQLAALPNLKFLRWAEGTYRNKNSKAVLECAIDGNVWAANVDSLLNAKRGCPKCAKKYRYSEKERESQLSELGGMVFVEWEDGYKNSRSKAIMRCEKGHTWAAEINSLLFQKSGCPACAQYGFNPGKPGTLYALRSECGQFIKIGISNNFKRRLSTLTRKTPFQFNVVATLHSNGDAVRRIEKMFHIEFEVSGHEGFDGATEWLKFTPDILALMRALGA